MNGLDMLLLGHRLIKLGEEALPESAFHRLPAGVRTVLLDVFEHPGSSISEITARTGFPQSLVSAAVARFRDRGVMVTEDDPADRRRTLVSPAPGAKEAGRRHADATTVDAVLSDALGAGPAEVAEIVAVLESLARRLREGSDAEETAR
jgi:DNA-binding MarR family transcriptional regulator